MYRPVSPKVLPGANASSDSPYTCGVGPRPTGLFPVVMNIVPSSSTAAPNWPHMPALAICLVIAAPENELTTAAALVSTTTIQPAARSRSPAKGT